MKRIYRKLAVLVMVVSLSIGNSYLIKAEDNGSGTDTTETSENLNNEVTESQEEIEPDEPVTEENDTDNSKLNEEEEDTESEETEAGSSLLMSLTNSVEEDEPEFDDTGSSGEFTSSFGFTDANTTLYAVNSEQSINTIDSLITDEAAEEFDRNVEKMKSSTVVNFSQASQVLKNSDGFRLNGGLNPSAFLSSNPYLSAVGLIDTDSMIGTDLDNPDTSKAVYIKADSTANGLTASSYIYVVDKDAVCIVVTDENGMGIGNALVTISYVVNGNRVTRSMRTTNGNVKGAAAFDDMDTFNYCLLDISADGYESKTMLEETLTAGEKRTFNLKKREADSVYIRGLDLHGKDMIFSDTDLFLVSENFATTEIPFSILVTATGSKSLPFSVELYSKTRKKVIATFTDYSKYEVGGENTAMFTLNKKWMNQNISPLAEDDDLVIRYSDKTYEMKGVTVRNAVVDPGATDNVEMPIFSSMNSYDAGSFKGKGNAGSFADIAHSSGMLNASLQLGPANVTIGCYPDGGYYVLTTVDIKKLSSSWGDIFEDTWDPKDRSDFNQVMQKFKQDFWDRVANSVRNNEDLNPDVDDEGMIKELSASYGGIKSQCSILVAGKYNNETGLWEGSVAGAFSVKWYGGRYTYYLIPVGPVVVPAYAGLEGGITGRGTLEFQMAWRNGLSFDDVQTTPQGVAALRIDIMPYVTGYFGLGIKGIMSGQLDATATLDAGFKLEPFGHQDQSVMKGFLNIIFKLGIKAQFLFYSMGYTLASSGWIKILGDAEPPLFASALSGDASVVDLKTYRVDLNASEEKATLETDETFEEDGTINLAAYKENTLLASDSNLDLTNNGDITLVADNTYADGQIQMVSTATQTVLFRIIAEGGKTKLVYHHVYSDGKIYNKYNTIWIPDNASVVEYSAVPNKAQSQSSEAWLAQYKDYVYIGLVCTDSSKETIEGQLASTFIEGVIIDVKNDKQYRCQKFIDNYDPDKLYYYYSPMIAGNKSAMTVAYKRCEVTVKEDGSISADLDKAINIMQVLDKDNPVGEAIAMPIGKGELYCNGAWYDDNDPVFWLARNSTDGNSVRLIGFAMNGVHTDKRGNAFNITLNKPDGYEFSEGERFISHLEMMNGMVYVISCGNLYYMDNASGSYKFETIVTNGSLSNASSIYQFFMSGDQKLLYIAAMKSNVDRNGLQKGSKLQVYTVYVTQGLSSRFATIHGPLEIEFDDVVPNNYTVSYISSRDGSLNSKGFSLAFQVDNEPYLTSSETIAQTTDLYFWNQKSYDGLIVKKVSITNNVVSKADPRVSATVTFQNAGCRVAGPVRFLVQSVYENEQGEKEVETLKQVGYNFPMNQWFTIGDNQGYYYKDIFAGDELTCSIYFVPSQNWRANVEYEIVVSIDPEYNYRQDYTCPVRDRDYGYSAYSGNRLSSSFTTDIADKRLYLNGSMNIVNGEHVIELSVENRSYYMAEDPKIIIVPDYDYNWTDSSKSTLCTSKLLKSAYLGSEGIIDSNEEENNIVAQTYNKSVSVEKLLESGAGNGLQGVYVYLVDETGERINSTELHFDNPYYKAEKELPVSSTEKPSVNEVSGGNPSVNEASEDKPSYAFKAENKKQETELPLSSMNNVRVKVDSDMDISITNWNSARDIILNDEDKQNLEEGKQVSIILKTESSSLDYDEQKAIKQYLIDNHLMGENDHSNMDKFTVILSRIVDGNNTQISKLDSVIGMTITRKLDENESLVLLRKTADGYEIVKDIDNAADKYGFDISSLDDEYVLVTVRTVTNIDEPLTDGNDICSVHILMIVIDVLLVVIALLLAYVFYKFNLISGAIIVLVSVIAAVLVNIVGFCKLDLPVTLVSECILLIALILIGKYHK